jgi:hygromycin-B 4-O-kinase
MMGDIKPDIPREKIDALLADTFSEPVRDLKELGGGLVAQSLSFTADGHGYVLQFMSGGMEASYRKMDFLYRNFNSPALPLPEVIRTGSLDGAFYGISRKMPGRGLKSLTPDEYRAVLPRVIEAAHAIHTQDVGRWNGYGWIRDDEQGMFDSWRHFIEYANQEEGPGKFFGKWHALFETSFLDRAFFDRVYGRMTALVAACPDRRCLVHGGFGFDNVLVQDGSVTALLDWEGIYGDFAFDIAYIDFWPSHADHVEAFRERYSGWGMDLANYHERVLCYKYHMGLDAMKFFAKAGNRSAYDYACDILQGLLA